MPTIGTLPEFDEVRLPEKIAFGFSGGPTFFTQVASTAGGSEQRNASWEDARYRYQASHDFFEQSELDELLAFFLARRGKLVGFRFFDAQDYATDMVNQQSNFVAVDTLAASGVLTPQQMRRVGDGGIGVGDGVETQFQLMKTYLSEPRKGVLDHTGNPTLTFDDGPMTVVRSTGSWVTDGYEAGDTVFFTGTASNDRSYVIAAGGVTATTLTLTTAPVDEGPVSNVGSFSNDNGGVDYLRDLVKPIRRSDGVIQVRPFVNAVAQTEGPGFSIVDSTGVVTFTVAPAAGVPVTADALFDVPVRFDSDVFDSRLDDFQIGSVENVRLIELRA